MADTPGRQDTLFGPAPRRRAQQRPARGGQPSAAEESQGLLAQVAVDVPHAHLDHPFSYTVPDRLRDAVRPGVRVAVPFAGRQVDGWVLDVATGPVGSLRDVRRVVTPFAVLTPEVAALARRVADARAGTLVDVLRSAVPPRHATAERALLADGTTTSTNAPAVEAPTPPPHGWSACRGGEAFLARLADGQSPRAAVRLPLDARAGEVLLAGVAAARRSGRSAVVVLPDVTAVEEVAAALRAGLADASEPDVADAHGVEVLHHDLGPAARWRAYCRVLLGRADVVIGTRSAVFAPVADLGLLAVWDDGDDGHVEPHAPGWDSAEVASARAEAGGAGLALLGHSRSVRTQWWVRTGRLKDVSPDRANRRAAAPRVLVPDPDDPLEVHARVPRTAHRALADALREGPALISVPRSGYASALHCGTCRAGARCRHCSGRLRLPGPSEGGGAGVLTCTWCARADTAWRCAACQGRRVRAGVVGAERSAEELGRAFPGVPVVLSRGGHRVAAVDGGRRLVVATPGAEPVAAGGYRAALLLDGDLSLARPGLSVEEETLRRWLAVAALVRPVGDGGVVALVADPRNRVVQALVSDAPEALADRLCDERAEAGLPPARTVARWRGAEQDLARLAAELRGESTLLPAAAPTDVLVLGPAPGPPDSPWQLLLAGEHDAVTATTARLLAARSAAKDPGRLQVRVDPADLD